VIAGVAGAFKMDPAEVLKGSDKDIAVRLAAERVWARMLTEAVKARA